MQNGDKMELDKRVVRVYRSLPKWARLEMNKRAQSGWEFSGDELMGWSWVPHSPQAMFGQLNLFNNHDLKVEFIASEPRFYIDIIRELMKDLTETVEMSSEETRNGLIFKANLTLKDGEKEDVFGKGETRLLTLLDLYQNVCQFYWENHCPSLADIDLAELRKSANLTHSYIYTSKNPEDKKEMDIFEDHEGHYSISFPEYQTAQAFVNKYSRFIINSETLDHTKDNLCWGVMKMVEGDTRIYSSYEGIGNTSPYIVLNNQGTGNVVGGMNNTVSGTSAIVGGTMNGTSVSQAFNTLSFGGNSTSSISGQDNTITIDGDLLVKGTVSTAAMDTGWPELIWTTNEV